MVEAPLQLVQTGNGRTEVESEEIGLVPDQPVGDAASLPGLIHPLRLFEQDDRLRHGLVTLGLVEGVPIPTNETSHLVQGEPAFECLGCSHQTTNLPISTAEQAVTASTIAVTFSIGVPGRIP